MRINISFFKIIFLFVISFSIFSCNPESVLNDKDEDDDGSTGMGKESVYDYEWKAKNEHTIELKGNAVVTKSKNVQLTDTNFIITKGGYYHITGSLSNSQLMVDADDETVYIKLHAVSITNNNTAPFYVKKAEKVVVFLADNTINTFTDAALYSHLGEPNACVFSDEYLAFTGNGTLVVNANANDGMSSDDALVINGGKFSVTAKDDGVRGKDFLLFNNGEVTVDVLTGHALKSDHETRGDRGFVRVKNGRFDLSSTQGDGINSTKRIVVDKGIFTISAPASQAVKSDSVILITDGEFVISQSDDGIKAPYIQIDGGKITIVAYEDALKATFGKDHPENLKCLLTINGGNLSLNSAGAEAFGSAGSVKMNGGRVMVHGSVLSNQLPIDYKDVFDIKAGIFVASGSASSKFKGLSNSSQQISVSVKSAAVMNSLFSVVDAANNVVFSFKPEKTYFSVIFSLPVLKLNQEYKIFLGGTNSVSAVNGFSNAGILTGGTLKATFTPTAITHHVVF